MSDLAQAIGSLRANQSLEIILDGDGIFVYQYVSREVLADPELAHLSFGLLVDRRLDERRRNGEDPTPHKETERSSDGR
jgi:hypothetical protein